VIVVYSGASAKLSALVTQTRSLDAAPSRRLNSPLRLDPLGLVTNRQTQMIT